MEEGGDGDEFILVQSKLNSKGQKQLLRRGDTGASFGGEFEMSQRGHLSWWYLRQMFSVGTDFLHQILENPLYSSHSVRHSFHLLSK